jgi:hypothetical protein
MKKAFTLIIAVLTVVSVMAQSPKKTKFTKANVHQKSIEKLMEIYSPDGLNQDFEKHPEFLKSNHDNKSVKEFKQVLDSMDNTADGMVYYREKYTYNIQGNVTLIEELGLSDANTLEPSLRSEYSYDAAGNIQTYIFSQWDEYTNDWFVFFKMEYTYSNGLLTLGNTFAWNADLNNWELNFKEEYSYDAQDRLTTVVTSVDNNGTWEQMFKEETAYNTDGYAYLWMDYNWSTSTNSWTPNSKDEDFFDANGDVELNVQSIFDETSSSWLDVYKSEYTYNANHQMLTEIYFELNETTMEWAKQGKDEFSYDEHGNITETISSGWDASVWLFWSKEELTFDYSVSNDEVVYPGLFEDFQFSHQLTNVNYFEWEGNWIDDEQFVFYYSEKDINGIATVSSSEFNVYPNPGTGLFNLEISGFGQQLNISVLDFAGQVIEQEEVNNSGNKLKHTLDLSSYSKGVYFLRCTGNVKSNNQTIVIQ